MTNGSSDDLSATLQGSQALLVASTGGHLSQLKRLAASWGVHDNSVWVTFDSPQSRSLLRGERVVWVPYVAPRDLKGVLLAYRQMERELKEHRFDSVVSTGAAVALSAAVWAVRHRVPMCYVESVSRVQGPSLTGRILHATHRSSMFTQHESWSAGRWRATRSVLESFQPVNDGDGVARPSLFVTLGTIRPYRFDALVDAILETGLADSRTVWQVGVTDRPDLPGTVIESMNMDEMHVEMSRADVVVSHCGVGSILDLLELGKRPVLVPRRADHGEHVDNHQMQIADLMMKRGLALVRLPHELSAGDLVEAAGWRVE